FTSAPEANAASSPSAAARAFSTTWPLASISSRNAVRAASAAGAVLGILAPPSARVLDRDALAIGCRPPVRDGPLLPSRASPLPLQDPHLERVHTQANTLH